MDNFQEDSSSEEKDIKPIIGISGTEFHIGLSDSDIVSSPKKWLPTSLQDGNRKSAFLPYKFYSCNTVLTNLQRGNTLAENPLPEIIEVDFHTKAGQGELSESDIIKEDDINIKDSNDLTPLHWACFYGQFNAVQLLVTYGADVNDLGSEEESPLILAAASGHHDIVRFLLNYGADVNHVDHMCNTALMYAAKENHPHTCQELLMNGANYSLVNLNDDSAHSLAIDNNSTLAQTVIENFIILQLETSTTSSPSLKDDLLPSESASVKI